MADPRLARIQAWIGNKTVGAYLSPFDTRYGGRSVDWRQPQFTQFAEWCKATGLDYALVKFGEWGREYYNGIMQDIRDIFISRHVGMAPYIFARPQTWQADAQTAIKAARICGGVVIDAEEQFIGFGVALHNLLQTVRNAVPNAVIIVSGYGDPGYAMGGKWPMGAVNVADGYQPQGYYAYWNSIYNARGAAGALQWSMADVAGQFRNYGVPLSMPITPCFAVPVRSRNDLVASGAYLKNWQASVVLWHAQTVNADEVAAIKQGLNS